MPTTNSPDASLFGNALGLEDAYRAVREPATSGSELPFKLSRPLDGLAIANHSAYTGFGPAVRNGAPNVLFDLKGREWYEGMQQGRQARTLAVQDFALDFTRSTLPLRLTTDYSAGSPVDASVWNDMAPRPAFAQESDVIVPPNVRTRSMGLPQTWRPEVGAAFYTDDRDDGERVYGTELHASRYRALANPIAGVGLSFEAFYRVAHSVSPNGGVRLMISVRYIGMQWGWEYDFRRKSLEGVFSFTLPLGRGGLFGQGDRLRLDWSAGAFRVGWTFPVRGRWMGTSRPERIRPSLHAGAASVSQGASARTPAGYPDRGAPGRPG